MKRKIVVETPAATPGGAPDTTIDTDPMVPPIPKKRPGDTSAWYTYYSRKVQEILHKARGRSIDKVQCSQEAYLEARYCPQQKKCEGTRMTIHLKTAGLTKVESCGMNPRDLAMVANEFCGQEGYAKMPDNFSPDRIRGEVRRFLDRAMIDGSR